MRKYLTIAIGVGVFVGFSSVAPPARAIGGISGSKLATVCTETVPGGRMEFEPYFTFDYARRGFDDQWRTASLGSRNRTFETGFRFTVGLMADVEIGLMMPILFASAMSDDLKQSASGLGDLPAGAKWRFLGGQTADLALQAGVTLPTGDDEPTDQELALGEGETVPELGLVSTIRTTHALSIDLSLVGGVATDGSNAAWHTGVDAAIGIEVGPFQPIVELNQTLGGEDAIDAYRLSTNVGFTFELNQAAIIVTGVRIDLAGMSSDQGVAYNLAFTYLI